MQAWERNWVLRATRQAARGLRSMPPACCRRCGVAHARAGARDVVGAGAGPCSGRRGVPLGGGVLSGVLTEVVHDDGGGDAASSQSGLEQQIAAKIEQVLAAGDANAQALRAEISTCWAGSTRQTALRAAMEQVTSSFAPIVAAFERWLSVHRAGLPLEGCRASGRRGPEGFDEEGASLRAYKTRTIGSGRISGFSMTR